MHIDIDFDVYKALTAMREKESDTYNDVLRRLLRLPAAPDLPAAKNALAAWRSPGVFDAGSLPITNALMQIGGTWFNGVHFPEGTRFKATYKGATYHAAIKEGRWTGEDGVVRNSPSDAASAITHTNVNGWRFWYALMPGTSAWRRMDEFKS